MMIVRIEPPNNITIGPMGFRIETDGESVVTARPEAGYLHRGIEKAAERVAWSAFLPYTDRIDYVSAVHGNLAYALAVESLSSIAVPPRANAIRAVVCELSRIASHLLSIGNACRLLGGDAVFMYSLRERERINNLFELLTGARLTHNYLRIGGVAADITEGVIDKTAEFLDYLKTRLPEYSELFFENVVIRGRLEGIGRVPPARAIQFGLTGPNLRASGLRRDVRKETPYCEYGATEFDVPVGPATENGGDAFSRFRVRFLEITESARIVRQVLERVPGGPFREPLPREFRAGKGEAYAAVESPRGMMGAYVLSDGGEIPVRARFRAPSFAAMGLLPSVLRGASLSDVAAIVSSFDICVSEVDR